MAALRADYVGAQDRITAEQEHAIGAHLSRHAELCGLHSESNVGIDDLANERLQEGLRCGDVHRDHCGHLALPTRTRYVERIVTTTPLSDLMSTLNANTVPQFHALFLRSELGVLLRNLPTDVTPGARIQAGPDVSFSPVRSPDGRLMMKACADPHAFVQQYPGTVNAFLTGRELLEMVQQIPALEGVLVCSALSFHSAPISRAEIAPLLAGDVGRLL